MALCQGIGLPRRRSKARGRKLSLLQHLRQNPETVLSTLMPNNYFSDKAPITFAKPDRVSADIGLFAIRSRSISLITFGSGLSESRAQAFPSGNSRIGRPPVWKSKFHAAFVLNRRVLLHAIDATPARRRGDAGSSPHDRAKDGHAIAET